MSSPKKLFSGHPLRPLRPHKSHLQFINTIWGGGGEYPWPRWPRLGTSERCKPVTSAFLTCAVSLGWEIPPLSSENGRYFFFISKVRESKTIGCEGPTWHLGTVGFVIELICDHFENKVNPPRELK